MSEYCAECNKCIEGLAVDVTLVNIKQEEENYVKETSEFGDYYCFECFPPDR